MNRENLAQIIWWETDVPVWLEKVVLPVLAAALMALMFVNPMKFDWLQRISLFIAILAFSYFLSHTLHLRNEAIRSGSPKHSDQNLSPAQVQPAPPPPKIQQNAEDSNCSNVISGRDSNVNCSSGEVKENAKKSNSKSP
jgi:hypothetical protein